jgi:hypothetical protein
VSDIDPYAYLHQVAVRMHELNTRKAIETVLDEHAHLFEVIPPEMQDNAERLIGMLREKLAGAV